MTRNHHASKMRINFSATSLKKKGTYVVIARNDKPPVPRIFAFQALTVNFAHLEELADNATTVRFSCDESDRGSDGVSSECSFEIPSDITSDWSDLEETIRMISDVDDTIIIRGN